MNAEGLAQAIYDVLSGDPAVSGAMVGIYTDVAQVSQSEDDSAFPYLTIGPYTFSRNDTKTEDGQSVAVTLNIWSRSNSALTWQALRSDVYDAMHRAALTVSGQNVISCLFDSSNDFEDPDGKTRHITLDFRITYFAT